MPLDAAAMLEIWTLWESLPEPKRLHRERGEYHLLVEAQTPDTDVETAFMAPFRDMPVSLWVRGESIEQVVRRAAKLVADLA